MLADVDHGAGRTHNPASTENSQRITRSSSRGEKRMCEGKMHAAGQSAKVYYRQG
jgi:hypothetical protein